MSRRTRRVFWGLWVLSGVAIGLAIAMMLFYAPLDPHQGSIQKIFYLHLGTAIGTLIAAGGVFAASLGYLWQRDMRWDALGDASARSAVLLLFIVLGTGMIWARQSWGRWWEWSPPLTFSLILWLLYVAYMVNRRLHATPERRASVSAVFGLLASLNVPLVYLSVRFLPASHLSVGERAPAMNHTLTVWIIAVGLLAVCMIWTRYLLTRLRPAAARPRRPASVRPSPAGGSA